MCIHVRSLGNWTNKLYEFFENYKAFEHVECKHDNGKKTDASGILYYSR